MAELIVRTPTSSVVTSVTIVESRNYISSKESSKNKVPVPKRPDKTPRFEFYLYNDEGRIIKQYLTIHEIQQILLQQSQSLGWFLYFQINRHKNISRSRIEAARLADRPQ